MFCCCSKFVQDRDVSLGLMPSAHTQLALHNSIQNRVTSNDTLFQLPSHILLQNFGSSPALILAAFSSRAALRLALRTNWRWRMDQGCHHQRATQPSNQLTWRPRALDFS